MTNEEFNRKVEFLLSRQADFEARMQHVQEAQTKDRRKLDETAEQTHTHSEALKHLIEASALLTNTVVDGMREGFAIRKQLSESMKHTDEKINVLIASHIRADEKFERHLREDHGLSDA
jgi:hypothetical protein